MRQRATSRKAPRTRAARDPLWYRDAIFYELRVGAFYDLDGDGVGDFRGLTEKLDYLQDLGITTIWLLPFYPSPFRDDGYDIADFGGIHPDYGTLDDFREFLREAHRRSLRVVTELVINHTSDQHPWFQRARRSPPGSRFRDYYVWSEKPDRYTEARIIFRDFEPSNWSWDPVAKAYYWHRFFSHQPDLNFDSPDVQREVFRILDFWLRMGVDGLRLDAIPYLFERDGTTCENLPETHRFLAEFRRHVDTHYEDRMLLAEANQWPEDAVAYFGQGDECHMCFHFPIMPRLFMSLHMEDRFPIIDIVNQTPDIPDTCQWALFLRNHDELTLEMVTDEERDYMYRVYAHDVRARINLGIRRRLAPLLGNDRRRIELLNALLFSLPGTPVLYYGDEIGMGDNFYLGDRNGVRTPMQWSGDRNAGFSRANPQRLYLPVIIDPEYHYESHNVEAQQANRHSLLHWTKRLIALRKQHRAFGRGTISFLSPSNRKVLAFVRQDENETILVVANLSRFVEYVELDLAHWKGMIAVELFGRKAFPTIGDLPYLLTLGPHSFYWFAIEAPSTEAALIPHSDDGPPELSVTGSWENLVRGSARPRLEALLARGMRTRRWFGGKARETRSLRILDAIEVPLDERAAFLVLAELEFVSGEVETYGLPLAFATDKRAEELLSYSPNAVYARVSTSGAGNDGKGILYDAAEDAAFAKALLGLIERRRRLRGANGELVGEPSRVYRELRGDDVELPIRLLKLEQSNSSIAVGERLILKLLRKVAESPHPEVEITRMLTERAHFDRIAPLAGWLEYRLPRRPPLIVAILQGFVPNEGDAWGYTLDQLGQYFERAMAKAGEVGAAPVPDAMLLDLAAEKPSSLAEELIGAYLETARLLGQRTAELHIALASATEDPDFAPEPFTSLYQRSMYQSMRNLTNRAYRLLRDRLKLLPEEIWPEAVTVLEAQDEVLALFGRLTRTKFGALRLRTHGDYHLGQVLHTGRDFVIVDFEGEPARSPSERRLKRSPLTDVAGMIRSFDYAAHASIFGTTSAPVRPEDRPVLEPWADFWTKWVSASFLGSYLETAKEAAFLPASREELDILLSALLLEKSVYELGYELDNRPDWVKIPIRGIQRLLTGRSAK